MDKHEDHKQEHPKEHAAPEWKVDIINTSGIPEEIINVVLPVFDTNLDGEISKQEAQANDAHESLFQVLTKLGVTPDDLAIALGIEPKAVREKRQKEDREERDRFRKEWEAGQKFDKDERERIRKETPTPVVQEPAGAWSAKVTQKSKTELVLAITNGTKVKGIVYRVLTDTKTGKVLSSGSRTISAGVTEEQIYNRSVGWPFATLTVDLKLNHPDTGAKVEIK